MVAIGFLGLVGLVELDTRVEVGRFQHSFIRLLNAANLEEAIWNVVVFLMSSILFFSLSTFGYGLVLEHYHSLKKEKEVVKHATPNPNDTILINYATYPFDL